MHMLEEAAPPICPHCLLAVHATFSTVVIAQDGDDDPGHFLSWFRCPSCQRVVAYLRYAEPTFFGGSAQLARIFDKLPMRLIIPAATNRPVPHEVPPELAQDYNEAALILALSPKASAALSRRCLQNTLRANGISKRDLNAEIEEAISKRLVSAHLADNLHAVRAIGNFAAHPLKDSNTGEIIEVEPDEAEWNLDVLDGLFEEWYVQPSKSAARKAKLNAKQVQAGKPPI